METVPAKRRRLKNTPTRPAHADKYLKHPEYKSIEERIKSYEKKQWRISEIQDPKDLAEAGLFYEGMDDVVTCFFCGGAHSNWQKNEDPSFEHAKFFPYCAFTIERKGKKYINEVQQVVRNKYSTMVSRLLSYKDFWPLSASKTPEELAEAGFFHTGFSDEVQCFECRVMIKNWNVDDDVWFKHAKRKPVCKFVTDVKGFEFLKKVKEIVVSVQKDYNKNTKKKLNLDQPIHSKYNTIVKRIASFENWPIPEIKKPEDLAEIGLFYSKDEDTVYCFHCSGEHYGWKEYENPSEEHARWYPACKFIRQIKGEKYVEEVRKKYRNMYATEESRKETFKNWPKKANKTPEELYKAGFFSTNNQDQTQCFDCGYWHINWEIYDDPWFIHAKLNPSCKFVRKIRGELFFNKVKQILSSNSGRKIVFRRKENNSDSNESSDADDDEILALMKSSTIQTVLEIGFDGRRIICALRDYLKHYKKINSVEKLFAIAMKSQKSDPVMSACLRDLEESNTRLKSMKVCKGCDEQYPIMLCVPCGHLHSYCFCVGKNLKHCYTCKNTIEYELEMFTEGKVSFLNP